MYAHKAEEKYKGIYGEAILDNHKVSIKIDSGHIGFENGFMIDYVKGIRLDGNSK